MAIKTYFLESAAQCPLIMYRSDRERKAYAAAVDSLRAVNLERAKIGSPDLVPPAPDPGGERVERLELAPGVNVVSVDPELEPVFARELQFIVDKHPLAPFADRLSAFEPAELSIRSCREIIADSKSRHGLAQWRAVETRAEVIALIDAQLGPTPAPQGAAGNLTGNPDGWIR